MKAHDHRRRELAVIHILKKQLGMDDDTYQDMLFALTRKRSSGELDDAERQIAIRHMQKLGGVTTADERRAQARAEPAEQKGKPVVAPEKQALVDEIDRLLADGARPWNYARQMAKRMFKVDRFEWATPAQLHSIVAALKYQQKRGWDRGRI